MSRTPKVRTFYRPVGLAEMVKILESDATQFPPRLPEQPIFYPVLEREYAEQIAERWNAPAADSGHAGFVTECKLDAKYAAQFNVHLVGSALHRELWVPAEQLEEFNHHIVGPIAVVGAYYGDGYVGPTPRPTGLKGRAAREQLPALERILDYNAIDFMLEILEQRTVVQLNFAYWVRTEFTEDELPLPRKLRVLQAVRDIWTKFSPAITLIGSDELQGLVEKFEQ